MKEILKHLYYGNIAEANRPIKNFCDCKEAKESMNARKEVEAFLSEEGKAALEKYWGCEYAWLSIQQERTYANGVKTGFLLAMEIMDFSPEYWIE